MKSNLIIKVAAGVVLGYLGIVGVNLAGQVVAESTETDPQIQELQNSAKDIEGFNAEFDRLRAEGKAKECAEGYKASCK
jgi:hypothetical protein